MRPVRLGRLELRRFTRSRLTRAALAGVVMLPLLYAGLYLWSFWDPQGNLENIPVALVMEDRPAEAGGETVDAGRELADELVEREVFAWRRVNARQAADGVADGSFYLSLTIPADFSARLASPSGDGTPTPAELGVTVDTGRSYIMGTISDAVFAEVKDAASRTALKDYWDGVFVSFGELHDATAKAADGADRLHDGSRKALDGTGALGRGAGELSDGLGRLRTGTRRLSTGLGTAATATGKLTAGAAKLTAGLTEAADGSRKLGRGLGELTDGARQVADGNAEAYRQVHAQVPKADRAADAVVPVLKEGSARLRALARALEQDAETAAAADGAQGAPAQVRQEAGQAREQAELLLGLLESDPGADPELRAAARRLAQSTGQVASGLADGAADAPADGAGEALARLRRSAPRVAEAARYADHLADRASGAARTIDEARDAVHRLDEGLGTLADGSAKVHRGLQDASAANGKITSGVVRLGDGAGELSGGLTELGGGVARLRDGAAQADAGTGALQDGTGRLAGGIDRLAGGLGELADGSRELSRRLGDGAGEIPDYDAAERAGRTEMMSEPVTLASSVLNEVPDYGTGFAPFFVPLALWVGAMVAYMVLRPLNPRLLAGTAPAWRIAVGGWVPGLALGAAQVGVLAAVLRFALGLQAAHWAGTIGILLLTTAAFLAIVQAVNALLGAPGRVAVLALLMLQLTSAAGTYPIETSPGFFQTISPWLPMSWVVSALRRLISGGDPTVVWQACGVLVLWTALGLALSVCAVHRGRTWSMRRLHPELAL
ncbi:YhgE/Pip domain-containing protein [Planomonospora sp. ID82291]|uniref:YhgE/Pip domain-containing protein n=1 Tax=Planomonospora sp. ID82291 TaxID=2738136 RepID=UPI0018C44FF5|nr:YhgE/Pip domain-containing protein [Planomonospora sp. ID82291]MBG0813218.1 YhgE/Pip domain-containing protein [Planomonospora sp. ID82291]